MNDPKGKAYLRDGGSVFIGNSRAQKMAANNLGITQGSNSHYKKFRSKKLDKVEQYLEGAQYDHLSPWQECCTSDDYTSIRKRKPSIIFPFAKIYQDRLSAKLVGASTFPKFSVEEDEETTYFIGLLKKASYFEAQMLDVAKHFISYTSAFARYTVIDGVIQIEPYCSNYCYPEFEPSGDLKSVTIKYVYETNEFNSSTGKMICRWYKMDLGKDSETLYDNPEYDENSQSEPEFTVVSTVQHNLGFVQGEWFRFGENKYDIDGASYPMVCELDGFIDAINYNLSQSDSATSYGLDPQLVFKGMDSEDVDKIIKSSSKAWFLGRSETDAKFLEVAGSGVATAKDTEDRLMKRASDAARIVFLDPEKMVGNSQSGKAMEVMHGPLVEMINELRPWFEKGMLKLLEKMVTTVVILNAQGMELSLTMPPGWQPESLSIDCKWPPVFELTTQDKQQLVSLAVQVVNANIISRDTMAQWLQSQGVDFGVEDWEAERAKVDGQKQFGGFF